MLASYRTIVRNPDWHDNISLALATAQGNPNSAKACGWAGQVLVGETKEQWTKDFGESLLQRTIELYPTMGSAYWDLTKYYFRENRVADALIMMGKAARYHGGTLEMRRACAKSHHAKSPGTSHRVLSAGRRTIGGQRTRQCHGPFLLCPGPACGE